MTIAHVLRHVKEIHARELVSAHILLPINYGYRVNTRANVNTCTVRIVKLCMKRFSIHTCLPGRRLDPAAVSYADGGSTEHNWG